MLRVPNIAQRTTNATSAVRFWCTDWMARVCMVHHCPHTAVCITVCVWMNEWVSEWVCVFRHLINLSYFLWSLKLISPTNVCVYVCVWARNHSVLHTHFLRSPKWISWTGMCVCVFSQSFSCFLWSPNLSSYTRKKNVCSLLTCKIALIKTLDGSDKKKPMCACSQPGGFARMCVWECTTVSFCVFKNSLLA